MQVAAHIKYVFLRSVLVMGTLFLIAAIHMPFIELSLWLIGCFGAAAVLISANPKSRMAQPRSIVFGMILSSAIGLSSAHFIADTTIAILVGCGVAMAVMVLLDSEHPPGGAAALTAAAGDYDIWFLLAPITTGTAMVLIMRYVSLYLQTKLSQSKVEALP